MGKLRQVIMAEDAQIEQKTVTLNSDDIMAALLPHASKSIQRSRSEGREKISVFTPFRARPNWSEGPWKPGQDSIVSWLKSYKLTTKEVLGVLKHNLVKDGMVFVLKPGNREHVINKFVNASDALFNNDDVDAVTAVQSSSPLAHEMASKFAARFALQKVSVKALADLTRKKTAKELSIDEDELEQYRQEQIADAGGVMGPTDLQVLDGTIESMRDRMTKKLASWRKAGQTPATKDIPHEWRRFFDMHTEGTNTSGLLAIRGKIVAVVDDNIDRGDTFRSIEGVLLRAGAKGVRHIAGFEYTQRDDKETAKARRAASR